MKNDVETYLKEYQDANFVELYKRSSTKIEKAKTKKGNKYQELNLVFGSGCGYGFSREHLSIK